MQLLAPTRKDFHKYDQTFFAVLLFISVSELERMDFLIFHSQSERAMNLHRPPTTTTSIHCCYADRVPFDSSQFFLYAENKLKSH